QDQRDDQQYPFDGKTDPQLGAWTAQQAAARQRAEQERGDYQQVLRIDEDRFSGADVEAQEQQIAGHDLGEHPAHREKAGGIDQPADAGDQIERRNMRQPRQGWSPHGPSNAGKSASVRLSFWG